MTFQDFKEFKLAEGKTFDPTPWLKVTQGMIDHFAAATHDHQWIHIDQERAAKESPFKKTIAHGFLSLGLIPHFLAKAVQVNSLKMGVNYGIDAVRFPHPVVEGALLRGIVKIESIMDQKFGGLKIIWNIKVEIKDIKKPACIATMTTIAYEKY
ncbi:MAG: MaoC family dehydratase [Flavobacteriaceae bacterium]